MKKRNFSSSRLLLLLMTPLLAFSTSCSNNLNPEAGNYNTGTEVISAMYQQWENKWYPNFAFEQKVLYYENDNVTKEEVWQEIYSQPGKLHIRFDGFETGNGALFASDSIYSFANNTLQAKRPFIHNLVVLSFDVYFLHPDTTVKKLQQIGIDLQKITETEWQGRQVFVVGTNDLSDATSSQFWVDKERLYTVRAISNTNGTVRDVEMNNYQLIENNWVATEILFKTNGKKTMYEEYFNITFPETVDQSVFDSNRFATARW
jgi:hypothetical protein